MVQHLSTRVGMLPNGNLIARTIMPVISPDGLFTGAG
jgi:hypothetical protein